VVCGVIGYQTAISYIDFSSRRVLVDGEQGTCVGGGSASRPVPNHLDYRTPRNSLTAILTVRVPLIVRDYRVSEFLQGIEEGSPFGAAGGASDYVHNHVGRCADVPRRGRRREVCTRIPHAPMQPTQCLRQNKVLPGRRDGGTYLS
jgi:hypothetical protein